MARIAFVIDRSFDDHALQTAWDRVRQAGHDVVFVGPEEGLVVHGTERQVHITTDISVDDVQAKDVDAVLLPAGFPRNHLRTHERLLNFIRDVFAQGKPAGVMRQPGYAMARADPAGIRLASWPPVKRDLIVERSGPDEGFELDELIVSDSADPDAFCDTFLAQLEGALHPDRVHASGGFSTATAPEA